MPIKKKYIRKSPQMGEAGFTLIEMVIVIVLASILGIFVFGILTKCLVAQRDMQVRKERSDDAVRSMDKINRELREATFIHVAVNNMLVFEKSITSSTDGNLFVEYVRDIPTERLMRQSETALANFPWNSTDGSVIATGISRFDVTEPSGANGRLTIQIEFTDGSDWVTYLMPRNKPEPPPP